jgi:hydrogenase nickel incorporation protein HypB
MKGLQTIQIEEGILSRNVSVAQRLRARFNTRGTLVLNLLSSPGSGKTALLERTLTELDGKVRAAVIVGDLATANDGERLCGKGAAVVQIQTGVICHLDAAMIERALDQLPEEAIEILFIENVGNLVCPTAYDLGEALRVVFLSVTEGEDKPLKYPAVFN